MNSRFAAAVLCGLMLCPPMVLAEEAGTQLKEIVVTATKTEKNLQDVTQSVTVITADEIRKSGATTAAQVIERTASADVHDNGTPGSAVEVSLRGSTVSQVLVLLDGRRLNSSQSGGFDLNILPVPVENIERIEIVRGPSSALYGADALGGVINIITKKPTGLESSITSAGGSHGYWTLGAGNGSKIGNFYYNISANKEKAGGYRVNSDYDKTATSGKIGYDFSTNTSLELAANYIEKENGAPGSLTYLTPLARQWDRNADMGLTFRSAFTKDMDMRATLNMYRNKMLFKNPFSDDSKHILSGINSELQTNWRTAPLSFLSNVLTVGGEVHADHVDSQDPLQGSLGEHSASQRALYLQDEISIGDAFILVVGGRYDNHSVFGDNFSPKASARYLVGPTGTIIRASAGESYRAPTFNDLYWPATPWTAGNPDLKPEKSAEYEGGIEQPLGKGRSIKFTVFERHARNLIVWMPDNNFVYKPTNFSRARITGFEAEAKATFFDALVWGVNYTGMDTRDLDTGDYVAGAPAEQIKSYISYTVPKVKTNIYLEGRYVRNYWVQSLGTSNPTSHYGVLDMKILQPVELWKYAKADLFAGIKNITNRSYNVSAGYPMPPTEVYGGLTVRF